LIDWNIKVKKETRWVFNFYCGHAERTTNTRDYDQKNLALGKNAYLYEMSVIYAP
jgi:hypothetical protein